MAEESLNIIMRKTCFLLKSTSFSNNFWQEIEIVKSLFGIQNHCYTIKMFVLGFRET